MSKKTVEHPILMFHRFFLQCAIEEVETVARHLIVVAASVCVVAVEQHYAKGNDQSRCKRKVVLFVQHSVQ